MRFAPVGTAERQAAPLDHVAPKARLRRNARDFLARRRTQTTNAIRAHLAGFGIVVAKGIHSLDRLIEAAQDVPEAARPAPDVPAGQLRDLEERIEEAAMRITAARTVDPIARRLAASPASASSRRAPLPRQRRTSERSEARATTRPGSG